MSRDGRQVPLDQIGHSEIQLEEPILKRRDRTPVITIRSDINEATQPPEVSQAGHDGPSAADRIAPGRISHRDGRNIEESAQGQCRAGQDLPGHDRRHADRHHPAGSQPLDDDDGAC